MRRLSPKTALIVSAFLNRPDHPQYGYELMQETGIKSGSLYPILGRLEEHGWIVGQVEPPSGGRPPRRLYRLNTEGRAEAQQALDRYLTSARVPQPERRRWGLT